MASRRLEFAMKVDEQFKIGQVAETLVELRKRGVTHLVRLAADKELSHPELKLIFGGTENASQEKRDSAYRVYRLERPD